MKLPNDTTRYITFALYSAFRRREPCSARPCDAVLVVQYRHSQTVSIPLTRATVRGM